MKTYRSTLCMLLFFFLLVHKSVSPPLSIIRGLTRLLNKVGSHPPSNRTPSLKKLFDKFKNQINGPDVPPPPPPPGAPEEIINGLHLLKEYFYDYGYIKNTDQFNDSMDQETVSAIKTYQQFYNLTVTGYLDNETLQQLSLLRCGVPDRNLKYDLSTSNNVSWPKGTMWFPNHGNLSYGFALESRISGNMMKVFRDSFKQWSEAVGVLNLTETTFEAADIKIGFYIFDNQTVGAEVVGGTLIELASGNNFSRNVIFGNMLLDASKQWVVPTDNVTRWSWEDGVVDLGTVVMHQIGHLLGLSHSSDEESVMYPYILPSKQRKMNLSNDDQQQIKQLYHLSTSGGCALGSSWRLLIITTFSFGFACMVLLS